MSQAGKQVPIIAKLEKPEALARLDAILDKADGVMVARGDLGVELPPEEVPAIQKDIIRRANARARVVGSRWCATASEACSYAPWASSRAPAVRSCGARAYPVNALSRR